MIRIILAACAAAFFALLSGAASAQPTWVGIMDITMDTSSLGGCGDNKGEKHVLSYSPHISPTDPASAFIMDMGGGTIYVLNKDATSQFQGTGFVKATAISTGNPFGLFTNIPGNYNIAFSPNPIAADTSTIQISAGMLTLSIPGVGKCVFKFRGILTPAPAGG